MIWPAASRSGNISHGPGRPAHEWTLIEDMRRCAGWLLWSRRMASPLGRVPVKELASVLQSLGLNESQVSRIEHGRVHLPLSTIRGYERLLQLPYGDLQAPLLALARCVDDHHGRRWYEMPQSPDEAVGRIVDEIFDAADDGAPITGAQWLRLAHANAAGACDSVPTRLLARWTTRLLSEMMRSVNRGYFARLEAASTLATHDRTAAMVLTAVRKLTSVPGVSGSVEAWAVVGDIRNPRLLEQLIGPLGSVPPSTFRAFCSALGQPVWDRRLTGEQMARITVACAARLENASRQTVEVIDWIATSMPEELGGPLQQKVDRLRPTTRLSNSHRQRDVDAEVEHCLLAATEASWPGQPDGQLEALLRVVLLGKSVGHRMHTASLLWVSPYAAALTGAAASIAASDGFGPAARDAAIYLLSRTATPANEELLRSLLRESPRVDLRNACLIALAHIGALRPEDDLRPYLCDPETRWNAIYAAGITHHPHLTEPEADSVDARWWLSVGPGFWE